MNTTRDDTAQGPFQFRLKNLFVVVTVSCVILAAPWLLMLFPGFLLLAIGIGCVFSSLVHRPYGWISGLLFGILVGGMGAVALLGALTEILG